MAKIIDEANDVIYESSLANCKDLCRVLTADPRDVSEEDELKWNLELYTLRFKGNLKIIE